MRNVIIVALVLSLSSTALAYCNLPQPRLVCAEFFHEQAVVVGTMRASRHFQPKDGKDWHEYSMHVDRILKGEPGVTLKIWEETSSGRAAFDWVRGQQYLLFLSYLPVRKAWALDGCGNSGPIAASGRILRAIESAGKKQGALISGIAAPGSSIAAQGGSATYRAKVHADSRFAMHVPAGTYSIRNFNGTQAVPLYDVSYDRGRQFKLTDGACIQLAFGGFQ